MWNKNTTITLYQIISNNNSITERWNSLNNYIIYTRLIGISYWLQRFNSKKPICLFSLRPAFVFAACPIDTPLSKRALNNVRLVRRNKKWACPIASFVEPDRNESRVLNQELIGSHHSTPTDQFFTLIYIFTKFCGAQMWPKKKKCKKKGNKRRTHGRASRTSTWKSNKISPRQRFSLTQFCTYLPIDFSPLPTFSSHLFV